LLTIFYYYYFFFALLNSYARKAVEFIIEVLLKSIFVVIFVKNISINTIELTVLILFSFFLSKQSASKKRDEIVLFGATEIGKSSKDAVTTPRSKSDEEALPPEWKQTHARLVIAKNRLIEAGKCFELAIIIV
jgi:hypothetical protein